MPGTVKAKTLSPRGEAFIKEWEKLRLTPYKCEAGKWTIGWGSTRYEDGTPVAEKDKRITADRANQIFWFEANAKADAIYHALLDHNVRLNANQFDMLVSISYNIGITGLMTSTLFRLVTVNPNSPFIRDAFYMWNKITVDGKKKASTGLTRRRRKEAETYFSMEGLNVA